MVADLNVIDPDTVAPAAARGASPTCPAGARRLVQKAAGHPGHHRRRRGGARDGEPTGALPGRLLRGPLAPAASDRGSPRRQGRADHRWRQGPGRGRGGAVRRRGRHRVDRRRRRRAWCGHRRRGRRHLPPPRRARRGGVGGARRRDRRHHGRLDVLVNNAGTFVYARLVESTRRRLHAAVRGQPARRVPRHARRGAGDDRGPARAASSTSRPRRGWWAWPTASATPPPSGRCAG